jgi:hypothetical protein
MLGIALPLPAGQKDKARPNTLTAKEVADGWILLFDGESTFGLKVDGDVKAADELLLIGGAKKAAVSTVAGFLDYDLSLECKVEAGSFQPGWQAAGRKSSNPWKATPGRWGTLLLQVRGSQASEEFKYSDTPGSGVAGGGRGGVPWGVSHVVLGTGADSKVAVRNVKLRPVGLKSIFNGKDLTGWKEVKNARTKSQFTVTDKGELNVKNGPGDLQSEDQWDDFVLQLDVFSNGKHLNSGVFFRCLPGQFWSGYEAQIRNQWKGDDRTKAVDYGTGGIYNRQPARKVVSNDKEWFTMTVVANGKHLAVWVNGYQTADFTDNRPPDKSARKGSKVDAGPISLQGHDPTTDLSFRNFRVAALPHVTAAKKAVP